MWSCWTHTPCRNYCLRFLCTFLERMPNMNCNHRQYIQRHMHNRDYQVNNCFEDKLCIRHYSRMSQQGTVYSRLSMLGRRQCIQACRCRRFHLCRLSIRPRTSRLCGTQCMVRTKALSHEHDCRIQGGMHTRQKRNCRIQECNRPPRRCKNCMRFLAHMFLRQSLQLCNYHSHPACDQPPQRCRSCTHSQSTPRWNQQLYKHHATPVSCSRRRQLYDQLYIYHSIPVRNPPLRR
jgi:hypothetical protein